jgi:hypothetical protein
MRATFEFARHLQTKTSMVHPDHARKKLLLVEYRKLHIIMASTALANFLVTKHPWSNSIL